MSAHGVTDFVGRSPDDDNLYPGNLSQCIRSRRYEAYGDAMHGKCYICEAVGESYPLGGVLLCGDHRDAMEPRK